MKFDRIEVQFYGNTATDVVGGLTKIVAGGSPFDSIYRENITDHGMDQIIKELVCSNSQSYFVAGVDSTVELLLLVHYSNPLV